MGIWRKRWIVLKPTKILTYKSEAMKDKPTEIIKLNDKHVLNVDGMTFSVSPFKFKAPDSVTESMGWIYITKVCNLFIN